MPLISIQKLVMLSIAGLTVTLPIGSSGSAYAVDAHSEIVAMKISSDDLSTELGVRRVYQKLTKSASRVCETDDVDDDPEVRVDKYRECMLSTLNFYVEYINHHRLTAFHTSEIS